MKRERIPVEVNDPLPHDCWLVVDDPGRNIVESRRLPAGTNLMRVYLTELLRYHDDGWRVHEFSTHGAWFSVNKNFEWRHVRFVENEPKGGKSNQVGFFRK
jgi:hypothetical protein